MPTVIHWDYHFAALTTPYHSSITTSYRSSITTSYRSSNAPTNSITIRGHHLHLLLHRLLPNVLCARWSLLYHCNCLRGTRCKYSKCWATQYWGIRRLHLNYSVRHTQHLPVHLCGRGGESVQRRVQRRWKRREYLCWRRRRRYGYPNWICESVQSYSSGRRRRRGRR